MSKRHAKKINSDGSRQLSPALTACGLDAGGFFSGLVMHRVTTIQRTDNDKEVTCKRCVAALIKAGILIEQGKKA